MPFLKNVVKDLIEQRLWPVAILLVAALIAVPVLMSRHGAGPAASPALDANAPGASSDAPTASKVAVTLDPDPGDVVHDGGRVRDPFRAAASASSTSGAPTDAAASASAGSAGGPASSGSTTGGSATPSRTASGSATPTAKTSGATTVKPTTATKPKTTTATKPRTTTATSKPKAVDATDTYHVSLRFGVNGGAVKTIKDVARLSPLPSETDPFFVFLGVLQTETTHEQRAVFMVSSDATPTGEGACHPTKQDCETVELTKGQTVFFDYTAPDGTPTQYQLQLAGIHKTAVKSAAKAQVAIARHSAVGQELLRDAATRNVRAAAGARAYRYVPATGLLVRAKRAHVTAKAAAPGVVPGIALLDREHQPGIPVWRAPKLKP